MGTITPSLPHQEAGSPSTTAPPFHRHDKYEEGPSVARLASSPSSLSPHLPGYTLNWRARCLRIRTWEQRHRPAQADSLRGEKVIR
jgi:hypothetical protein